MLAYARICYNIILYYIILYYIILQYSNFRCVYFCPELMSAGTTQRGLGAGVAQAAPRREEGEQREPRGGRGKSSPNKDQVQVKIALRRN